MLKLFPPLPLDLLPGRRLEAMPSIVAAHLVNVWMRDRVPAWRLAELAGKKVRVCLTDVPVTVDLAISPQGVSAAPGAAPNVVFRGSAADIWRLVIRAQDPDTLFFERRLSIEGETETGLQIKNALDALDVSWEALLRVALPRPIAAGIIHLYRRAAAAAPPDR